MSLFGTVSEALITIFCIEDSAGGKSHSKCPPVIICLSIIEIVIIMLIRNSKTLWTQPIEDIFAIIILIIIRMLLYCSFIEDFI